MAASSDAQKSHSVYIIKSSNTPNKIYVGYTSNFSRRLRQHNGEIKGGAAQTSFHRPWSPVCVVSGFSTESQGLRFEKRLQHPESPPGYSYRTRKLTKPRNISYEVWYLQHLLLLLCDYDRKQKKDWPPLTIQWHSPYFIA
jgi:predicted GIY-YIG superfamily endonuclease